MEGLSGKPLGSYGLPDSFQGKGVFSCDIHGRLGLYDGIFIRNAGVFWTVHVNGWEYTGEVMSGSFRGHRKDEAGEVIVTLQPPLCPHSDCGELINLHCPPTQWERMN